jgi:hypothetical protein
MPAKSPVDPREGCLTARLSSRRDACFLNCATTYYSGDGACWCRFTAWTRAGGHCRSAIHGHILRPLVGILHHQLAIGDDLVAQKHAPGQPANLRRKKQRSAHPCDVSSQVPCLGTHLKQSMESRKRRILPLCARILDMLLKLAAPSRRSCAVGE